MANCILAFPNRVDDTSEVIPVFSGGSWEPSLPLDNLKDELLSKVARSTDATNSATNFDVDLGVTRDVLVLSLPRHNLSRAARIRIRASSAANDFSSPILDTSWLDVWPVVYAFGTLPFGHPSFWDGKLSSEDAALYNIGWSFTLDNVVIARYWRVEIDDVANPDGYVDLSRLVLAPGWQPTINMSYGATLEWQSDSQHERSLGGVDFFDRRDGRRVVRFSVENIPEDEAMTWPFEMQRLLGIDGQLYFIFNPDDTTHKVRRSFLARMETLNPITFPSFAHNSTNFQLSEVL